VIALGIAVPTSPKASGYCSAEWPLCTISCISCHPAGPGKLERPLPLPESISQPVIGGRGRRPDASSATAKPDGEKRDARAAFPVGGRSGSRIVRRTRRFAPVGPGCTDPAGAEMELRRLVRTYDLRAAQRGFQVYSEVCSNCHSMQYLHYRDLAGIGLNDDQIKALAAGFNRAAGAGRSGQPQGWPSYARQPVFVSHLRQ